MDFRIVRCRRLCNGIALQIAVFLGASSGLKFHVFFTVAANGIIVLSSPKHRMGISSLGHL